MKTKHLFSMLLLLFILSTTTQLNAQSFLDNEISLDRFDSTLETVDLRTYEVTLDDEIHYDFSSAPKSITEYQTKENAVAFVMQMIAFGVGFGFTEFDTLWCLHAEYYLRLALIKNAALYGSFGVGYTGVSGDNFDSTITDVFVKVLMVSLLAKQFQQVFLQYGVFARYGFGNNKFNDGFKTDLNIFSAGIVLGLHILLTAQWSLMVQSNFLTYEEQTNKFDGSETKSNSTFGLINKNNILALSLVYTFGNRNR